MNFKQIWDNWVKSWLNNEEGFSMRKRIAWVISVLIVVLASIYTTESNLWEVLTILTSYATALLGITTWGNVKREKIKAEANKTP